jgi:3-isopropylmalate/(R)-2-methylmalate dehydratase large subunit
MSIECGAVAGLISPDETTYNYIKGKTFAPEGEAWDKAVKDWQQFASDKDASYDETIVIDVAELEPMVTWGTNPDQAIQISEAIPVIDELPASKQNMAKKALDYIQLDQNKPIKHVPIDWAFIGSCTNGRIEDLRVAASILDGKKVHESVTMYIVPGSESVLEQAKQEGLDKVFTASGVNFRMPGCSLCLGMNDDKVPEGKRCISATNRNFVGRQGSGSYTHLASPATVAASAIAGKIVAANQMIEV